MSPESSDGDAVSDGPTSQPRRTSYRSGYSAQGRMALRADSSAISSRCVGPHSRGEGGSALAQPTLDTRIPSVLGSKAVGSVTGAATQRLGNS